MSMTTNLQDPRVYVETWLNLNGVVVQPNGILTDKEYRNKREIFTTLWLDYRHQVATANLEISALNIDLPKKEQEKGIKGISDKDMERALDEAIERVSTRKKLEAINAIVHKPQLADLSIEQLDIWITAIAGESTEVTRAVMQHWLWSVKRKMARLPVVYHLMPVIVSAKQGNGKSTAIKRLVEPLQDFVLDINADFISDDRNYFAFGNNFVAFMDEMAGVQKADVETLKRAVTADRVSARRMKTNDVYQVAQLCSFIGTANKSVGLLINDTSMRRFFEIEASDSIDWTAINSLDYLAILQGIDEQRKDGYILPHLDALRTKQENLSTKEPTQIFIDEISLTTPDTKEKYAKEVRTADLYSRYVEFCEVNGFYKTNSAWFGKRLRNLGFTFRIKKGISYLLASPEYKEGVLVETKLADVVPING